MNTPARLRTVRALHVVAVIVAVIGACLALWLLVSQQPVLALLAFAGFWFAGAAAWILQPAEDS